jgi:diguanylate cyclase
MTGSPTTPASAAWRPADLVAFTLGVSTALVIAVGDVFTSVEPWLFMVMYGLAACCSGGWLLATRYSESDRRWRQLFGVTLIVWGSGQIVLAVELRLEVASIPSLGDLISVAAFPIFIAGITRAVWSEAFVRPVVRMVVDALLMASVLALLIWRLVVEPGGVAPEAAAFSAFALPSTLLVAAFGMLVFIRRPQVPTGLFAAGLMVFAVADLVATFRADLSAPVPGFASALYAVAMPMFATGARMASPEPNDGDDVRRDLREASMTIVITAVVVMAVLVHIVLVRQVPEVTPIVYTLIAVGAFFARHLVDHAQRHALFGRLREQALADPLTGIGNRFALDAIGGWVDPEAVTVMVVGLDGMHEFGAAHGQEERDALVVRVARGLSRWFDDSIAVVRLESDEFAIVVANGEDVIDSGSVARQVTHQAISRGSPARPLVRVVVGVAAGLAGDRSVFDAVIRAQRARHLARSTPNRPIRWYDDALRLQDEREQLIDQRLPGAIDVDGISAHFQPIVSLARGAVVGVEALARWDDPVLGQVGPDEFIGRAEATDQIDRLGLSILRQAAEAAMTLGFPSRGMTVAVNVSPAQLRQHGAGVRFADQVGEVLAHTGLPARLLVVEVTESLLVEEHDPAVDELRRLTAMGVQVGVDDFGSGFWALGYFRWLPADVLKIDRSLVCTLVDDERSRSVVSSIVHLARRTGMTTVAEGIEDDETARVAGELGVRFAQGWAFGRPVPAERLAAEIARIECVDPALVSGAHLGPVTPFNGAAG